MYIYIYVYTILPYLLGLWSVRSCRIYVSVDMVVAKNIHHGLVLTYASCSSLHNTPATINASEQGAPIASFSLCQSPVSGILVV